MPVIDRARVPVKTGSIYPEPYAAMLRGRSSLRLAEAGGLTQFGVNLVTLDPGALSSRRHWHRHEDEFVMVVQGECTLVEDAGETVLRTGDCAAFPAGDPDGHHLVNRTDQPARVLVVGTRSAQEVVTYADVDMVAELADGRARFVHKDGTDGKGLR